MARGRSSVSINKLISAGLLAPGQELRLRGSTDQVARITNDGRLTVKGKVFNSPSTASTALLGTSSNGWVTWRVRHRGQWVSLADLRAMVQ